MTWEKPDSTQWPTPLLERKGRLGKLVREYVQETEEHGRDDAGYQRLMARASGPAPRPRKLMPILAAGLAAAGAVAALVGWRDHASPPVPVTPPSAASAHAPSRVATLPVAPPAEVAPPATAKAPAPVAARLRLQEQRTSLPVGRVDLGGQAIAILSADGVASGRTTAGHTEIVLGKGELELHVLPRAFGHAFSVRAGRYRFTVLGTVFTVSQSRSRLELMVREGKVTVSRGGRQLAVVAAGEKWAAGPRATPAPPAAAAPAMPSPAAILPADTPPAMSSPAATVPAAAALSAPSAVAFAPQASTPPARPTPPPGPAPSPPERAPPPPSAGPVDPPSPPQSLADCRQLVTSRRTSEALLCYQAQSAKGGLGGETAQYELARVWRDSLGDRARALAAFEDQRSRFPGGALRIEADLSIIELLPRLGRHGEAMAETERFLAAHPRAERRGEIRLLRGNIFREVLRDLARAELEYALGAESGGRTGDDCRFLHAVCLEAQGRVAEARKAYEAYLLGNPAAHTQEVRTRLERMRP